jgi:signal peptidase
MTQTSHRATSLTAKSTGPFWWIQHIVTWALLIATLSALLAVVVVPRVSGATPYTVLTGSMRPTYPPGTLIVVKEVPTDELAVGTVVTYQLETGEAAVVTHRIVAVNRNTRGETLFVTQGDANAAPDINQVRPEQIRGKVWYAVPYLGHVNSMISGSQHKILLAAAVGLLLLYAVVMFYRGARESRRERQRS